MPCQALGSGSRVRDVLNRYGANAGLVAGFLTAVGLTWFYLGGITTGIVGLAVNLAIYMVVGLVVPQSSGERSRVARLFEMARQGGGRPQPATAPAGGE